jgi:hypothetical protein
MHILRGFSIESSPDLQVKECEKPVFVSSEKKMRA